MKGYLYGNKTFFKNCCAKTHSEGQMQMNF